MSARRAADAPWVGLRLSREKAKQKTMTDEVTDLWSEGPKKSRSMGAGCQDASLQKCGREMIEFIFFGSFTLSFKHILTPTGRISSV